MRIRQLLEGRRGEKLFRSCREDFGEVVGSGFEFGEVGGVGALAAGGDVDAESFAAASDRDRSVGFEECGDALAEFADAYFNGGHGLGSLGQVYTSAYTRATETVTSRKSA